jgi:phosphoserine phosphatase RsbU/P
LRVIRKKAGRSADEGLFRAALDGMTEPAALLGADGKPLYANGALTNAQGCGGTCSKIGCTPCEDCMMASAGEGAPDICRGGKSYECAVAMIGGGIRFVLWHDRTLEAETSALLKRQYDKMRRDIFHSRSIQASLLPRELAKADGYAFKSLYKPSEEMSGDIFDLIRIGRDNIAFYIADVAGHGVTAAMLTIFFSTAIRVEMRPTDMPGRVLSRVHNRFLELELEEQHYITAFLGRLELSTGRLFWCNAGHTCPPWLLDASGKASVLEMAGLPISRWFEAQEYNTDSGQMERGGRLALFSDGLEAQWRGSGAAGDLNDTVCKTLRECAADDCLPAIWRAAGAGKSGGRRADDTTMLLIDRLADGGNEAKTC